MKNKNIPHQGYVHGLEEWLLQSESQYDLELTNNKRLRRGIRTLTVLTQPGIYYCVNPTQEADAGGAAQVQDQCGSIYQGSQSCLYSKTVLIPKKKRGYQANT